MENVWNLVEWRHMHGMPDGVWSNQRCGVVLGNIDVYVDGRAFGMIGSIRNNAHTVTAVHHDENVFTSHATAGMHRLTRTDY